MAGKQPQKNAGYGYKGKTVLEYNPSSAYMYSGFYQNHILFRAKGEYGVRKILHDILNSNTGCQRSDLSVENVLRSSKIQEEFSIIQENFRKFNFSKLQSILNLDLRECDSTGQTMSHQNVSCLLKASPFCMDKHTVDDEIEVEDCGYEMSPTNKPVNYSNVIFFLKKVLETIVPLSVWGDRKNFEVVKNFLWKLISLGAKDTITIDQLLDRMKMKAIRWPQELSQVEKIYVVSKFFIWIVKNVVIAALKAFLYPSQMSGEGKKIFFFKKGNIFALYERSSNMFEPLPENAQVNGRITLLPKKTKGVRPLFVGVNESFRKEEVHNSKLLLRYLSYKEQGVNSSSPFAEQWKNALSVLGKEGALYFVKTDIKDAFGSVDTFKLKELLHSAVEDSRFLEEFKKYVDRKEVDISKDERAVYCQILENKILDEEAKFSVYVQECVAAIEVALHPGAMFRNKKVTLASGLPQGCCLSSDLCDFYYSKMTSMFLHDLTTDGNGVLLRAVDDFLYLSRSQENARSFKDRIIRGIPEFNCFVNKSKTISNCSSQVQRTYFNGFILCFTQEAVFLNTSNLATVPVRYSMTFNNTGRERNFIMAKLLQATGSLLPYHLISQRYSDLSTLLDNVWRMGMLCGPKIYALVNNAIDYTGRYNSTAFVSAILGVGKLVFRRIMRIRTDNRNLGMDMFISIFICSIYCSLTVISCDTKKVLTRKLRDFALGKLKNVKSTDDDKILLQYLENLLTGSLLV